MKIVVNNRKAFHDYSVIDTIEAGIELVGTEVKSIRVGKINLMDSYAQCLNGEAYIIHLHISPYKQGYDNHDPYRKRKLLLRKREISKLKSDIDQKGLTLIPLKVYFKGQRVKIELGLCRGKKKYDKRESIRAKETKRQLSRLGV